MGFFHGIYPEGKHTKSYRTWPSSSSICPFDMMIFHICVSLPQGSRGSKQFFFWPWDERVHATGWLDITFFDVKINGLIYVSQDDGPG